MSKLKHILDYHYRFQPDQCLKFSLGDGYLLTHNKIFSLVRTQIHKQNVQLGQDLSSDHMALPLSQLEILLKQNKIFYVDNVSVLKKMEESAPQAIEWQDLLGKLKQNFVFHESCHFISRKITQEILKNKELTVLQVLFEESFSNSCELLAIKDAQDNMHRHFYELNSYIFHPEHKNLINELIVSCGIAFVFQWVFMSYLYSNFLQEVLHEKMVRQTLEYINSGLKISEVNIKKLKVLTRTAFELNPDFKLSTTKFYLRYNRIAGADNDLRSIDLMKELSSNPQYKTALLSLTDLISH